MTDPSAPRGTEDRIRVLFALPSLAGGGAQRVIVTLLAHLDRQRFRPELALVDASGPYLADVPSDVPVHALGAARMRHAPWRLFRLLREQRPHVAVSTLGYMNFVLLLVGPLVPSVKLVVREVIGEAYLEGRRLQPLFYRGYLRLVRRADRIVTQSEAAARELRRRARVRSAQVTCIHNPVDRARVAALGHAGPNPFDEPGPHVVAAGRLGHQKGFDLLIEAVAGVRRAGIPARVTILGDGEDESALVALARTLGVADAVRFVGFQANPYPYFTHADVFVLSSRYEGLPNVVLEALACGTPVVAFDCPHGVSEIVVDGANGRLLPPENVPALREALLRVLGDPTEHARLRAGIGPTLAAFDAPAIAARWSALLAELSAA